MMATANNVLVLLTAVLHCDSKSRFLVRHVPKFRPIWMKFGRNLLLYGMHLLDQFTPIGTEEEEKVLFLYNTQSV